MRKERGEGIEKKGKKDFEEEMGAPPGRKEGWRLSDLEGGGGWYPFLGGGGIVEKEDRR